ncbi:YceI family protein, partial [Corynebacterium casei]
IDENGNGTLTGDLTIRETTKSVTLDVETEGIAEDPFGNTRVGFEASTKIDRTEFGLNFNAPLNTGGVLVSEKVTIEIEGSAIKNA